MPRRAELPNLTPARLDITHYRGDSIAAQLRMRSQGVPVDVREWDMEAHVRENPDSLEIARFEIIPDEIFLNENGKPIIDPTNGEPLTFRQHGVVRIFMDEAAAQMLPSVSSWDFQVREAAGPQGRIVTRTLVRGFIYAPADITHENVAPVATRRR